MAVEVARRVRLKRREISYERQKIKVVKVTPQTPTLMVSRVFESFEDGVAGASSVFALS